MIMHARYEEKKCSKLALTYDVWQKDIHMKTTFAITVAK
jgi:hypothetical protein